MFGSALLLGLAALFLATGASKALRWRPFLAAVASYRLVPRSFASGAVALAICGEIAGAVLSVGPEPFGRVGLVVMAAIAAGGALLAGFDLLAGNTNHPCGCFAGEASSRLEWWHPLRSAAVATLAGVLAVAADPIIWEVPWPQSLLLLLVLAPVWSAFLAAVRLQSTIGTRWPSTGPGS